MDAVVLVGGEGTRLRPLTYDIPKQMLPVVDRPMIEHVVGWLAAYGIDRVVLSLGYRADRFLEAYPEAELEGVQLAYAVEETPLDTAGAIRFAALSAGVEGAFVVLNADVLTDVDLGSLIAFHRSHSAEATIQLTPVEDPSAFGVVPTHDDGRVIEFIEKPPKGHAPTNLINAGCYVLEPTVIDRIPDGRRVSIERETFPALAAESALFATASDSYWLDTGTPEKYLQANRDILEGRRAARCRPRGTEVRSGVFVADNRDPGGEVIGSSYLGRGVVLGAGCEVDGSVLLDGVVVEAGARVSGSIVLPNARIGERAVVESAIVGPDAQVGQRAAITALSVLGAGCEVPAAAELAGVRFPEA
jgi:mannose-1-phosphate guanylyltransferase